MSGSGTKVKSTDVARTSAFRGNAEHPDNDYFDDAIRQALASGGVSLGATDEGDCAIDASGWVALLCIDNVDSSRFVSIEVRVEPLYLFLGVAKFWCQPRQCEPAPGRTEVQRAPQYLARSSGIW